MNVSYLNEKIETMPQGVLAALAAAVAFLALLPAWLNYDIIARDGAIQYVPMARLFLEEGFSEVFINNPQLPLFPLIIAAVSKLTGLSLEMSGRTASYVGYILAASGMFMMAGFLFRKRSIAFLAFLFLITNRQLINRSIDCLKESLFLCCIIWGNYLILKGITSEKNRARLYITGTLILVLGGMFRSTVLVFICAWIIIWILRERQGILARASLLLIPVAGGLAAWLLCPEFVLFSKSSYHLGYFFDSTHGIGDILKSNVDVIKTFFQTGNPVVILFGLYGLFCHERDAYFYHVCLVLLMFFLILVFWTFASSRYFLAPIVWIYPVAGYGVLRALQSGLWTSRALGILTVVSCLALWGHISLTPPDPDKLALKEAGVWILARIGPDHEVISNRDRLVFYAQGRHSPLAAFQDKAPLKRPLAIDTEAEGGKELDSRLHSLGLRPDRRFRSISVYLPRAHELD